MQNIWTIQKSQADDAMVPKAEVPMRRHIIDEGRLQSSRGYIFLHLSEVNNNRVVIIAIVLNILAAEWLC